MGVTAIKPGILTTVQDRGRTGYLGSGFSPSGVMDTRALHTANLLVDNDPDAPVLEFCLAGPTLRFTTSTYVAIHRRRLPPHARRPPRAHVHRACRAPRQCAGVRRPENGHVRLPGHRRRFHQRARGHGQPFHQPECGIGGWKGRALITGDYLPFCTRNIDFIPNLGSHTVDRDDAFYGFDAPEITLRVVPGPQEDMFTQDGVDTFYGQAYTTTSRCDRMGFRLDGPEIETVNGSDIISDGIALGAVQIPADGRPIIMLSDRQTTGGYAKIGTVCSVDLPKLVQCTPGRVIRFAPVTIQQAQDLYRQEARRMDALAKMVKRPCYGGISPRRTARRLTPILEAQARAHASGSQKLWIELSKTEQQRLQPAEQPASESNR
mgnify:CR=1 FL=1